MAVGERLEGVSGGHRLAAICGGEPPWILGVLNCTPDSFSDGGRFLGSERAIEHARSMHRAGAHAIDIGGESTRPGGQPISADEELRRIEPVVAALSGEAPLSIDTFKAAVARRCLDMGAAIVNDVSALRADPEMIPLCAELGPVVIMMYSKEAGDHPHATRASRSYGSVVDEIAEALRARAEAALAGGIREDRIVLDPGMGVFVSPDPEDSWALLRGMERLVELLRPFPIAVCTSRKGFLGGALADRDPIPQLTALHAIEHGVSLIRTHHVPMLRSFLDVSTKLS